MKKCGPSVLVQHPHGKRQEYVGKPFKLRILDVMPEDEVICVDKTLHLKRFLTPRV